MSNDLNLSPEDMLHLPGGTSFTQEQVDSALGALRTALGWHVAPVRVETVAFDVRRDWQHIQLPTLKLEGVTAVRDVDSGDVIDPALYRVSAKLCTIHRTSGAWPSGYAAVEVDFSHGYATLPAELLTALGDVITNSLRDGAVRSVSIDDFQQSFGASSIADPRRDPYGSGGVLDAYSLYGSRSLYGFGIA